MKNLLSTSLLSVLLFCTITVSLFAQSELSETVRKKHFENEDGVALQGYDPVSYHKADEPEEGSKKIQSVHKGITYYFASEENKKEFEANPSKYEPAYGGWCAYAFASNGKKMQPDAETFKIIDGELFMFYNSFFNNTLPKWNKDESKMKMKADETWKKILMEK